MEPLLELSKTAIVNDLNCLIQSVAFSDEGTEL